MKPVVREITDAFFRWLSLPNYDTVEIVAATVIANRLPGEPLWLALVGPSSSGKTEVVRALDGMSRVHMLDKITPATWASGFRLSEKRKRRKVRPNGGGGPMDAAAYGLLTDMMDGKPHIVVVKDFSSVLGKRKEVKSEILSDLRQVYDGRYYVPFANGIIVDWTGKVGMIVCSTGQYDQQVGDLASFGERFCVWRAPPGDPVQVAERSGRNSEKADEMRRDLAGAMGRLDSVKLPKSDVPLSLDARTHVSRLTAFVALCRTPVPRDPYTRAIITIPEPEGTGRLSAQLHQLMRGLVVLYGHREVTDREAELVKECAFGTIPTIRRRIMEVMSLTKPWSARAIEMAAGMPHSVCQRAMEEMELLGLVEARMPAPRGGMPGGYMPVAEYKSYFRDLRAKTRGQEEM